MQTQAVRHYGGEGIGRPRTSGLVSAFRSQAGPVAPLDRTSDRGWLGRDREGVGGVGAGLGIVAPHRQLRFRGPPWAPISERGASGYQAGHHEGIIRRGSAHADRLAPEIEKLRVAAVLHEHRISLARRTDAGLDRGVVRRHVNDRGDRRCPNRHQQGTHSEVSLGLVRLA